jgi:hypothetical protein
VNRRLYLTENVCVLWNSSRDSLWRHHDSSTVPHN